MKRMIFGLIGLIAILWFAPAQAARSYSAAQTSPTPTPGQFDMGTTQSITLSVTNTSTGANSDERLYQVQFQLSTTACSPTPCTNTVFSSATTAPAGWTRTAFSGTSITFKANSFADALGSTAQSPNVSPTTNSFTLVLAVGTFTADLSQTLSKVTARLSPNTNFGGSHAVNCTSGSCLGSWKAMSLQITSFQTTDLSGAPIGTVIAGTSFKLAITVKNISTVTQSGITIANLTSVRTGSWQGSSPNCGSATPASLTLASGVSGTITYTCTTNANDSGTVYFTANARNGTNTATSRTATSNTLACGNFTAAVKINGSGAGSCVYLNGSMTVTMDLTNGFSYSITGVTPTLTPPGVVTLVSGPTPASVASIGANSTISNAFTWVYTFSGGAAGTNYTFTGTATGTASGGGGGLRTTPAGSATVTRGGYEPVSVSNSSTNASSNNLELSWSMTNRGCADVSSVQITLPGGWTYGGDSYSLIEQNNPPNPSNSSIEDAWTISGTNPILFQAPASPPNPNNNWPLVGASPKNAEFHLVFSNTPSTIGSATFTLRVTDTNGTFMDLSSVITENAFGSGTLNRTQPKIWREGFQ